MENIFKNQRNSGWIGFSFDLDFSIINVYNRENIFYSSVIRGAGKYASLSSTASLKVEL